MGWWEWAINHSLEIISLIGVGVTAFFLWYQINKSREASSADFTFRFIDSIFVKQGKTLNTLGHRKKDKTLVFTKDELEGFLNEFETVAQFVKKRLVDEDLIRNNFITIFELIAHDEIVKEVVNKEREKDLRMYRYIIWYLNKNKIKHNFVEK